MRLRAILCLLCLLRLMCLLCLLCLLGLRLGHLLRLGRKGKRMLNGKTKLNNAARACLICTHASDWEYATHELHGKHGLGLGLRLLLLCHILHRLKILHLLNRLKLLLHLKLLMLLK